MTGLIIDDLDLEQCYMALAVQSLITATTASVTVHTYLEEKDPATAVINTLLMAGLFVMVTLLSGMMVKNVVISGDSL